MHRSKIEAIIQKQTEILGSGKVKKLLLGIPEIQLDEQGRLVNLTQDDDVMLSSIINVFLDFSHEIVKSLLFEVDNNANQDTEAQKPKPIETPSVEDAIGVSREIPNSSKEELVALDPDDSFKHSGSDAIQKALESLDDRTSAEGSQSGPSTSASPGDSAQASQVQTGDSVQKLNDLIKQYNS